MRIQQLLVEHNVKAFAIELQSALIAGFPDDVDIEIDKPAADSPFGYELQLTCSLRPGRYYSSHPRILIGGSKWPHVYLEGFFEDKYAHDTSRDHSFMINQHDPSRTIKQIVDRYRQDGWFVD